MNDGDLPPKKLSEINICGIAPARKRQGYLDLSREGQGSLICI